MNACSSPPKQALTINRDRLCPLYFVTSWIWFSILQRCNSSFTRLTNKYLLSLDNVNETIICSSSMHLSLLDSLSINNIIVSLHIEIINFPSLVICKSEILTVF
ncbi:hypothetical protein HanXRQr2_Chr17g0789821 [Helianthus annuus]|uniref:Uncharacterized protein n=1 Tax=Helianthus annuus TaxID=4232 RepID=A0A9K3GTK0_HELAN|nr:hypothetical protein HanXRQr2_Chr17g0789821 [Helianthus annuus]